KSQPVKMGKKSFEGDRRSVFGVSETPGGVRIEHRAHEKSYAKPAVSGVSPARPATHEVPSSSQPSAHALPPPTKVIEIKVAPPVRRETVQNDPRFGVVVPATDSAETEKT